MRVGGQLGDAQRVRLLASPLSQSVSAADVNRRATPQVRKREVHPTIAVKGRTQQREQRLVLVDGQQLSVAQRPTPGCKLETHKPDFTQEWLRHPTPPSQ